MVLVLVQVQEERLTLALRVDVYHRVGHLLDIHFTRFGKTEYLDVLHHLGLLLAELDIVQRYQVVCRHEEVEVVSEHKRKC